MAALLAVAGPGCTSSPPDCTYNDPTGETHGLWWGYVEKAAERHTRLPGATVRAVMASGDPGSTENATVTADENGCYELRVTPGLRTGGPFEGARNARYDLKFEHAGYRDCDMQDSISAEEARAKSVVLVSLAVAGQQGRCF